MPTETSELVNKNGINILKSRDDTQPIIFELTRDGNFSLYGDCNCSWAKQEETFGPDKLRSRIEPWLSALFQSEHLSVLIGSGLTNSVYNLATGRLPTGMNEAKFGVFDEEIREASKLTATNAGRNAANIEDQIRVTNELLKGLNHYCSPTATFRGSKKLREQIGILHEELERVLKEFASSILDGEKGIASANEDKREEAFSCLINFLMSFASRSGTRDRLQIFTTNYDRVIEAGAELAGLHLLDRFIGNLTPIFRSSRLNIDMHYNPPGIRGEPRYLEGVARYTKLHGSIDWVYSEKNIRRIGLPFGSDSVNPYTNAPGLTDTMAGSLMIYPNAAKDRETAAYPYVELFRDFAAAACRPNSTLVTYGYSFGDEHINRVIEDMLTIPSTHLVIISFSDPLDRIIKTYNKIDRKAQTTLLVGNHLGDLKTLVDHYLPKPAIDRTTIKMVEMLKARFGADQNDKHEMTEGEQ